MARCPVSFRILLPTLAAAGLLAISAPASGRGRSCSFQASGLSMAFGTLDPSTGSSVSTPVAAASLNANTAGDCSPGTTMTVSGDNGLNFNGSRNLKNATGSLIPYTLVGLPQSRRGPGNGTYVAFTFSGTIAGSAYANASAGAYSDNVIISVTP